MIDRSAYDPELRVLEQHLRKSGSLLDVGAATGDFLMFVRGLGMTGVGIDPDPARVAEARAAGEDVRLGRLTAKTPSQFPPHSFDLVSFRESLYYMDNHDEAFDAAKALLAPKGAVYIKSHVPESPYYWRGIPKLQRVGPSCTWFLTQKETVTLLNRHGFKIVGTRRMSLSAESAVRAWRMPDIASKLMLPLLQRCMRFLPPDRVLIVATLY